MRVRTIIGNSAGILAGSDCRCNSRLENSRKGGFGCSEWTVPITPQFVGLAKLFASNLGSIDLGGMAPVRGHIRAMSATKGPYNPNKLNNMLNPCDPGFRHSEEVRLLRSLFAWATSGG